MTKKRLTTRAKIFITIFGILFISIGIQFARSAYDHHRNVQRIERTLTYNGYTKRIARSRVSRNESGPFSGIIWYEYTFANQETLKASRKYNAYRGKKDAHLTLKNCPIVYRVILTPPSTKYQKWSMRMYLDANTNNDSVYIQKLTDTSDLDLKLKKIDW